MRTLSFAVPLLLVILAGCSSVPEQPVQSVAGTSDRDIGLVRAGVLDTPEPAPVVSDASEPGEDAVLPRAYPGAPPLIPHGIADFLPITRDGNVCVDCHLVEEKVEGEATPIPSSHLTDLRSAPDTVRAEPAGARWLCVSCHVPQTDAPALVTTRFGR